MTPLILLVFANDNGNSLSLREERRTLTGIFNDPAKLEYRLIDNAEIDLIADIPPSDRDRIVIFHFGGHADKKNIKLLDGQVQIARLLSEFKKLQFVFLNGCDTYEQASLIRAANPAVSVLTTLIPVDDRVAIDFARYFYLAFYRLNTLNNSFEWAQTRMTMKYDLKENIFLKSTRGFGEEEFNTMVDGAGDGKNIYTLSCPGNNCLNKTLLLNIKIVKRNKPGLNYRPNRQLIRTIAESIVTDGLIDEDLRQNDDFDILEKKYNSYLKEATNDKLQGIAGVLLSILPYPVGFHINLLLANANGYESGDEKKVDLLSRQIITYNCMIQMLCFILLSCLWVEMEKGKSIAMKPNQFRILSEFFSSQDKDSQEVNFAALLVTLNEIITANSLDIFLKEYRFLTDTFGDENSLHEAHLHMQGANASIQNETIFQQDINELCMETEEILCRIFTGSGFIVKYKLATIKHIELTKSRIQVEPSYFIKRIILNRNVLVEDDIVRYPDYTNSRAVILARSLTPAASIKFLPLSPFVIDENAIKGEKLSRLFFYSHCQDENYVFQHTNDPTDILVVKENETYTFDDLDGKDEEELRMINLRMTEIWAELSEFKTLLSRKSTVIC